MEDKEEGGHIQYVKLVLDCPLDEFQLLEQISPCTCLLSKSAHNLMLSLMPRFLTRQTLHNSHHILFQ
jgi:hypothetical protein